MNFKDITIVICCAGMGTRLGIGTTKSLVKVCGKQLIIRQMDMLEEFDDVRIVVGYQAEDIIRLVNDKRNDVMFAFNYDYATTGVAASLTKAIVGARKYTVVMDGDMLVNPEDFRKLMEEPRELIGVTVPNSDEPVFVKLDEDGQVIGFERECGEFEWSGIAKIETERLSPCNTHVFDMLTPLLPISAFKIRSREIDTPDDYDRMINWVSNEFKD